MDSSHRPILILPHTGAPPPQNSETPDHTIRASAGDAYPVRQKGSIQAESSFTTLSIRQWLYLTVLFPKAIKQLIMQPDATESMNAMRKAYEGLRGYDIPKGSANRRRNGRKSSYNLTGKTARELGSFLAGTPDLTGLGLHVAYNPSTDYYRVELRRATNGHGKASNPTSHPTGAWQLTSISTRPKVPELILTYKQNVFDGARILYVPPDAGIAHPLMVPLSKAKGNGGSVIDFWIPQAEPPKMRGSSTALLIDRHVRERFQVGDLLATIRSYAAKAREEGKQPAIVSDLDGTVFDARAFVWVLSNEWLETYDGPDAQMIRHAVAASGKFYTWNINSLLTELGFSKEKHAEAHESAAAYFESTFRSPVKRLEAPPIKGMVKLMRILQKEGLKTVYVTLRSESDDQLPNGESSSETQLKNLGIFNENSVLLRHTGDEIDWSVEAYESGKNEPEKWMMVKRFRKRHPDIWFVAVAENAPAHTKGYREFFEYSVVNIHVQGDNPPNSPELPDGVFTVNPGQLLHDLEQVEQYGRQKREMQKWEKGEADASSLIRELNGAKRLLPSEFRRDHPQIDEKIKSHAAQAETILSRATSLSADDPQRFGFIEGLYGHTRLGKNGIRTLEDLEDMIHVVNAYRGSSFGTLRGPGGLLDVVRTDSDGQLAESRLIPPPIDFSSMSFNALTGVDIEQLGEILPLLPPGPDITDRAKPTWHNDIALGHHPRMEFLLRTIVGALTQASGKKPHEIHAIEYGPRLAIGAMIALARMDVTVGWKDVLATNALHTNREVGRLPEDLRAKIKHLDHKRPFKTDLAIWNLPLPCAADLKTMGQEVVEGGLLATQTNEKLDHRAPEGWRCLTSVPLGQGEYVLPSTFLYVANGSLTFQLWQRTAL